MRQPELPSGLPRRIGDWPGPQPTEPVIAVWGESGSDVLALARGSELPQCSAEPLRRVLDGLRKL